MAQPSVSADAPRGRVVLADNLRVLGALPDDSVDLIYVDPPFNTGRRQTLEQLKTIRDAQNGDRTGFQGQRYRSMRLGLPKFRRCLRRLSGVPRAEATEFRRVLKRTGTLYVHLDAREVHYVKVLLDAIFGRACFLNEIIWAYDYGGRPRRRWPPKHDSILVYVSDPQALLLRPRSGRAHPVHGAWPRRRRKGRARQTPDRYLVVDHRAHQLPRADRLPDPEAAGDPATHRAHVRARRTAWSRTSSPGSGTTGAAAYESRRPFLLVDNSPEAVAVMRRRFAARQRRGDLSAVEDPPHLFGRRRHVEVGDAQVRQARRPPR